MLVHQVTPTWGEYSCHPNIPFTLFEPPWRQRASKVIRFAAGGNREAWIRQSDWGVQESNQRTCLEIVCQGLLFVEQNMIIWNSFEIIRAFSWKREKQRQQAQAKLGTNWPDAGSRRRVLLLIGTGGRKTGCKRWVRPRVWNVNLSKIKISCPPMTLSSISNRHAATEIKSKSRRLWWEHIRLWLGCKTAFIWIHVPTILEGSNTESRFTDLKPSWKTISYAFAAISVSANHSANLKVGVTEEKITKIKMRNVNAHL